MKAKTTLPPTCPQKCMRMSVRPHTCPTRMLAHMLTCVLICMLICVICTSCAPRTTPHAENVLLCMLESEKDLPSGRIYTSNAAEGDSKHTPNSLLSALYGEGSMPVESGEWIEYAIFLSNTNCPCELAVFLCNSPQSALDTSKMLCRRLDTLKTGHKNGNYNAYMDNAAVTVSNNYCIFIISSDTPNAKKHALSYLG